VPSVRHKGAVNILNVSLQHSITALAANGWSRRRIARELGIDRETLKGRSDNRQFAFVQWSDRIFHVTVTNDQLLRWFWRLTEQGYDDGTAWHAKHRTTARKAVLTPSDRRPVTRHSSFVIGRSSRPGIFLIKTQFH